MDYKAGDTVVTEEGTFLIVSAEGFDISDGENTVKYILIDVRYGSMEGYAYDLDEIWKYYHIEKVILNRKSHERRKESE